jgi:RimJ/RimL family protein N-acetyltransferase
MILINDNLKIRSADINDTPLFGSWWRDGVIMEHAGFPHGLDITDDKIEKQILSCSDDTFRLLIIEIDGIIKGEMNYHNMGFNTAQMGIKICDFSLHGKGYGTMLIHMLIEELFNNRGFERIILDVNPNNKRACHVYEKLGFRQKGIRVDNWKNQLGELQSSVDYELTKDEFSSQLCHTF